MNRRGFLQTILAAGVAPAFIGSSILMPVRQIRVPEYMGSVGATLQRDSADEGTLIECEDGAVSFGNRVITPYQITRKAVELLERELGKVIRIEHAGELLYDVDAQVSRLKG